MSETKWTPGPWDLDEGDQSTIYQLETTDVIAEVFGSQPASETEANARLIAAAPELYEALKAMLDEPTSPFCVPATRDMARAVLAKARGE